MLLAFEHGDGRGRFDIARIKTSCGVSATRRAHLLPDIRLPHDAYARLPNWLSPNPTAAYIKPAADSADTRTAPTRTAKVRGIPCGNISLRSRLCWVRSTSSRVAYAYPSRAGISLQRSQRTDAPTTTACPVLVRLPRADCSCGHHISHCYERLALQALSSWLRCWATCATRVVRGLCARCCNDTINHTATTAFLTAVLNTARAHHFPKRVTGARLP